MNQYILQQWQRINKSCFVIAKHFTVELPEKMKVTSGNAYQRMRDRTTALADFLDMVSSEIEKAKVEETQPDGEAKVDEAKAKVEETQPDGEVDEAKAAKVDETQPDGEVDEAKAAKVDETQPGDGEVDEAKVENNKPPKKTSRRKK